MHDRIHEKKIEIEDNFLVIKMPTGCNYDVPLNRLRNEKEIIGWIYHLTQKLWFDRKMVNDFIQVAMQHIQKNTEDKGLPTSKLYTKPLLNDGRGSYEKKRDC